MLSAKDHDILAGMRTWNPDTLPILQLGSDFYDPVEPATFPEKKLRYWNPSALLSNKPALLGHKTPQPFDPERLWDFRALENNLPNPLALRYHGHQFQHYNPDLGDGRGFLYAQLRLDDQWYDLGTKGSGVTPYSRRGDGRLTLKGAVRESLATEMLQSLGVTTSKTLCFFETGENLDRNDEPSPTRSAVLTRFSKGHIRIGTFQRLAYFKQLDNIKKLTSYALFFYYPTDWARVAAAGEDENLLVATFFQCAVRANADLVAQVMMAGFVHGVLNTDNINVAGELFDYGPYRFLPNYDPTFTAAYFDQQGLYCYGRQPASFLWALQQLGAALKTAYPNLPVDEILEGFSNEFGERIHVHFLRRLNLKSQGSEADHELLSNFFAFMDEKKLPFEQTFFDFNSKKLLKNTGNNNKLLQKYANSSENFKNLIKRFENYDLAENLKPGSGQEVDQPRTLLIDEIEAIWKPIAEHDDWNLFEKKLQSIRAL